MKLPYGYVLVNEKIVVQKEKADVVRNIFEHYLAGASLGKIVDMLHEKCIVSPSGNPKWGRAAVDKLLSNENIFPLLARGHIWMLNSNGSAGAMWITTRLVILEKQPDINLHPFNKLRLFKSRFFCYTGRKRGELDHDAGGNE